jgi:putative NADH-flavin reductase
MKIVIFGATGGTGKKLVERGLAAGHEVVAVARRPEAVTAKDAQLTVTKGDVLDLESVAAALASAEVAISAIGPANNKQPGTLISDGVKNIVEAAKRVGVKRFVFESGLMVGDARGLSWFGKIGVAIYRSFNKKLCEDKRKAEATIRASGLDWVIVRPPALVHTPARGGYKSGTDIRLNPAKSLSHEDAADFLIKVASDPAVTRQILDVGY